MGHLPTVAKVHMCIVQVQSIAKSTNNKEIISYNDQQQQKIHTISCTVHII